MLVWTACDSSSTKESGSANTKGSGPASGGLLPGAPGYSSELVATLNAAWASRPAQYEPRTRHLNPDGSPKYTNRLFLESSPYLQQHAHNPVNWYPWGDEAFDTARELGRPLLLSIGYSTCHWCHVMEEESFEDEEIATYLNKYYIAIKVDREERPDVDAIYMNAVQLLTGRGGWPMTVWLTPAREPFHGGTYFPARDGDRGAATGFLTLLRGLKKVYDEQPGRVTQTSAQIIQGIRANLAAKSPSQGVVGAKALKDAVQYSEKRFDQRYGGISGARKFPSSLSIRLLLRYHRRTGDEQALHMATLTLEKMAAGGMYDHVGGGFHRYSTDKRWLVPHFEKMLYDNALLVMGYLEGYQVTGREDFARVAREILRYVGRDMTSPDGAFYSATDADSPTPSGHKEEGWFFTWTPDEIRAVMGAERARIVEAYYAVTERGNFEGSNILHTPRPLAEVAKELGVDPERVRSVIRDSKDLLYAARAKRPAPGRDEKILASWNGLMMSAYARGALVLGEEDYAKRAERAADFVLTHMRKGGRLLRSYKNGQARHNAYLDDYAFVIAGLLDLYEATSNTRWLKEAIALDTILEKFYEDDKSGGYFMVSDDHEKLLAREKPAIDGAEPSGNSIAAMNLLRLLEFTTDDRYRVRAERTFRAFGKSLSKSPAALAEMLLALDFYLDSPLEIVIVTPTSRQEAEPLLAELRAAFVPNRVLAVVVEGDDLKSQAKLIPLVEGKITQGKKPMAYVCEAGVCELPTSDPRVFARQIRKVRDY